MTAQQKTKHVKNTCACCCSLRSLIKYTSLELPVMIQIILFR